MKRFKSFLYDNLTPIVVLLMLTIVGLFAYLASPNEDGSRTFNGEGAKYSEAMEAAYCDAAKKNDDAIAGLAGVNVPQDAGSGCEPTDLPQMGSLVYYKVNVASPAAFVNAVNGKGFNEGYGLQCVAGFKQFMYALSGKYVATKTGGASGYASQQAQIEPLGFKWHGGKAGLQDGDWGIFGGGQYGHVAMYYQGKWFGQNQGAANANAGNAFNLMALGTGNLIGFYRPNIYVKTSPSTPVAPTKPTTNNPSNTTNQTGVHVVQDGETLGGISLRNGWWPNGAGLYGDSGYTQRLAEKNGIEWRGMILPNTVIKRAE